MDLLDFRDFCLSLPLTEETTPFDEDTLVYKIGGKMYVYTSMSEFGRISLKCEPNRAEDLREQYPEIGNPVHMNNKHWISVSVTGDLKSEFIKDLIFNSYNLVVDGITPKSKKAEIIAAIEKASDFCKN